MNRGIDNLVWTSWRAALVMAVVTLALTFSQGTSLAAEKMSLVDINTASQAELEAVTGVGPAAAKKIIANRPYKSLDELSKAGLSAKKVESFKSSLTIGGAAAPAAAPAPAASPAPPAAPAGVGPTFPGGDTEDLQEELDKLKLEKSTLEKRLKELQERQKAGLGE